MDIQAYIASGILEQYVLGDLSATQVAEVERYASQYPEIRAEITAIEEALEVSAQLNAIDAPPALEGIILDEITQREKEKAPDPAGLKENRSRLLPILLSIGLLGLLIWGLWQMQYTQRVQTTLDNLQTSYDSLSVACEQIQTGREADQRLIDFLLDERTQIAPILGTDNARGSSAIVYWNENLRQAALQVVDLPTPPADKDYQLWALTENNTQESMGVFEVDADGRALITVSFTDIANGFAVTLEDKGGKPTPDLTQLQLIGQNFFQKPS